jgi:hypothetical protein
MLIGVVTTSYPRFPGDYAGSFVGDRVEQLRAEGHDVDVLAAGDERAEEQSGVTRISSESFLAAPHPNPLPASGRGDYAASSPR